MANEKMKTMFGWEILINLVKFLGEPKPVWLDVDCVVGVLRGGGLPAICASNLLGLPLYWVEARSYDKGNQGTLRFKNLTIEGRIVKDKKVLVCDDIFDSGKTMKQVMSFCKAYGAKKVTGFVLVTKDRSKCDFQDIHYLTSVGPKEWVVFPWEPFEDNQNTVLLSKGGEEDDG